MDRCTRRIGEPLEPENRDGEPSGETVAHEMRKMRPRVSYDFIFMSIVLLLAPINYGFGSFSSVLLLHLVPCEDAVEHASSDKVFTEQLIAELRLV